MSGKNVRFFNSLPHCVRRAISLHLEWLKGVVLRDSPKAVFTSEFRCPSHNRYVGGSIDSVHQYGCAVDVRLGTMDIKAARKSGLKVLVEKDHYHVSGLNEEIE